MSKRPKRKHSIQVQAETPPSDGTVPASGVGPKTEPPRLGRDLSRRLFEKALGCAKSLFQAAGKIGPTALFVYAKNLGHRELEESTTKAVSLSWKNESQKEIVRMRIQEKARTEGASAVILLTPDPRGPREGNLLISGAMPDMAADASVAYTLDRETGTLLLSEMTWRDEPVQSFFLQGLFTAPDTTETP